MTVILCESWTYLLTDIFNDAAVQIRKIGRGEERERKTGDKKWHLSITEHGLRNYTDRKSQQTKR